MPYVLFYSVYKGGHRVVDNATDHYSIQTDDLPVIMKIVQGMIDDNDDLASWGVAKIEAGSEPQWLDSASYYEECTKTIGYRGKVTMNNAEVLTELNKIINDCCFEGDGPNSKTNIRCVATKTDEMAQRVYKLATKLHDE